MRRKVEHPNDLYYSFISSKADRYPIFFVAKDCLLTVIHELVEFESRIKGVGDYHPD